MPSREVQSPVQKLDCTTAQPISGEGPTTSMVFGTSTATDFAHIQYFGVVNAQNLTISGSNAQYITLSNSNTSWSNMHEKITAGSTVPFSRDDNFVERKDIFDKIDEALSPAKHHRWAALYGLGGIGKSQLDIEYTFRVQDSEPEIWIFWVYSNSQESFVQSVDNAVRRLGITGSDATNLSTLKLFEDWLSESCNGAWFIVLDNVDDAEFLHQPYQQPRIPNSADASLSGNRPLIKYIPRTTHGRVLITSRDRKTASSSGPDLDSLIKVDSMSDHEALQLLKSRIQVGEMEEQDAHDLVQALENVPLAISQAGAYINQQGSFFSIREYLQKFNKNGDNQLQLLIQHCRELGRDPDVSNSIILTWGISFRMIERKYPEAASLLFLISNLHRQAIPLELIKIYDVPTTCDALSTLEAFSFITSTRPEKPVFGEDERLISLHRLAQAVVRKWLDFRNISTQWQRCTTQRMSDLFPASDHIYLVPKKCNALLLHAEEILNHIDPIDLQMKMWRADILMKLAVFDDLMGRRNQAVEKARACYDICRRNFGKADRRLWYSVSHLAKILRYSGAFAEAAKLGKQALDFYAKAAGPKHVDTVTASHELARTYLLLGRLGEADKLMIFVIETLEAAGRHGDCILLRSRGVLGMLYSRQGRMDEALEVGKKALEQHRATFGVEDPTTLSVEHSLGAIYMESGRWEEAEKLWEQLIGKMKRGEGYDHPVVLYSMSCHAKALDMLGRGDEALEIVSEVAQQRKLRLGTSHPETIESQSELARLEAKYEKAQFHHDLSKLDIQ